MSRKGYVNRHIFSSLTCEVLFLTNEYFQIVEKLGIQYFFTDKFYEVS